MYQLLSQFNENKKKFNFLSDFNQCVDLYSSLSVQIPNGEEAELEIRVDNDVITDTNFNRLINLNSIQLENKDKIDLLWNEIEYKSLTSTDTTYFNYRCRIFKNRSSEKIKKIFVKKWVDRINWISVFLSREIEISQLPTQDHIANYVSRKTCLISDLGIRIDASQIKESKSSIRYRIEFEFISKDYNFLKESKNKIFDFIKKIISYLMDSPFYYTKNNKNTVKTILLRNYSIFNFTNEIYQKPITLLKTNLKELVLSSYYITPKLNGERRFLIIFYGMVFSIDLKENIRYVKKIDSYEEDYKVTILDSEYINREYIIIDCLVYKDRENIDISLQNRLKEIEWIPFIRKTYIFIDPFIEMSFLDLYKEWERIIDIDGLIFSNNIYSKQCYKWKKYNTIDLLYNKKNNSFTTNDDYSIPYNKIYNKKNIELLDHEIYEISVTGKRFEIERKRNDKPRPNSYKIYLNNISNKIVTENHFRGKEFLFMRSFHNLIKEMMYESSTHNLRILDIGSGQGGDLSKWKSIFPFEIISIEKEKFQIEEMKRRNKKIGLNLKIIDKKLSDINDSDIVDINVSNIGLISLFFCMNGFDEDDFQSLFKIISQFPKMSNKEFRIIGSFLDDSRIKYEKTKFHEISVFPDNDKYYKIHLFDTRIDVVENKLSIGYINSFFQSLGYELSIFSYADFMRYGMSDIEYKISSMFCFFEYRRRPLKWYSTYIFSDTKIDCKDYKYIIKLDKFNRVIEVIPKNNESLYSLIISQFQNTIIVSNKIIFESCLRKNNHILF